MENKEKNAKIIEEETYIEKLVYIINYIDSGEVPIEVKNIHLYSKGYIDIEIAKL